MWNSLVAKIKKILTYTKGNKETMILKWNTKDYKDANSLKIDLHFNIISTQVLRGISKELDNLILYFSEISKWTRIAKILLKKGMMGKIT